MRRAGLAKTGLLGAAVIGSLCAQAPPPIKIGPLTMTGSLRTRAEAWDWFQGDADSTYGYSGSYLRLAVGRQQAAYDWQLESEAPFLLGLPDNAIAPGAQGQLGQGATYYAANKGSRNAASIFIRQAFVRVKKLGGSEAHSLRLGRFDFVDGAEVTPKNSTLAVLKRDHITQRLLGPFTFTHVQRTFDGLHYIRDRGQTNWTVVGARPTRGVFQTDGWGELDVAILYAALTRSVGLKRGAIEWRLLGLYYDDWRAALKTDNRPLPARRSDSAHVRIFTAGGHYLQTLDTTAGTFDALFWGVVQTGRWGVLDHRAGAAAVEAGYQPKILKRLRPWIRSGYFYGSGDGNPNDGTHHTFFQALPTARPYARFPFYNLMNNEDLFGQLRLRPHQTVSVRSDIRSLRLANRNDLWYVGGGAFQPWTFGYQGRPSGGARGLATLWDISADWQVNTHYSLGLYFASALGKGIPSLVYPKGKDGRFGYIEFGYRF